jgi:ParB family transcriptional regulator, chromosome partitioning protein
VSIQEAIEQNLSHSEIKAKVAQLKGKKQYDLKDLPTDELVNNVKQTYSKLSRKKELWHNPKNRRKIESLLKNLNQLLEA